MRRIAALTLLSLILGGCMLGPDYRRPAVETPQAWRFEEKTARDLADTLWWEQFNDPVLNGLIDIGPPREQGPQDRHGPAGRVPGTVRTGPGRPLPAGRGRRQRRAAARTRSSGRSPSPPLSTNPVELYQGSFFASWEIDLWGKLRRGTEAARANLLGTEEGRRGVILSLVASVAGAYVNLRNLDRQLWIARDTAMSRAKAHRIFTLRFQAGFVSELELSQAKSEYERALAAIPSS